MLVWILSSFVLGAIVGSFLNVLVLRYNTGRSLRGRSACGVCGQKLSPFELIPILSFLFLRGRCRSCGSKISRQYPLVELATALMFALIMWSETSLGSPLSIPWQSIAFLWVISALLIAIATYDFLHKIIPDGFVYTFIILTFLWAIFWGQPLTGIVIALPFAFFWLVSHGRWMGLGDAKLAVGIGLLLGISGGFTALILGVWIGAAVAILALLFEKARGRMKGLTLKSEIPFGPFLVLGTFVVFLTGFDLFTFLQVI